jgi:hypothetical protein
LVERSWHAILTRFGDDDAEWGLSRRTAILLFAAPFAVACAAMVAIPFRGAFRVLVNEDGIAEWGQFVLLVLLIPIYARISLVLWRRGQRRLALVYALATLAVFFAAGEEISWGQRIFGWLTPGTLEDINNQGETNIHNIGPLLTMFNLGVMGVAFVAAALPLLRWSVWRDRARSIAGYALIPPAVLIPAFGMEFSYRAVRLLFLPAPRYTLTKLAEIGELSFYFGLFVFGLLTWRVIVRGWRPSMPGVPLEGRPDEDRSPAPVVQ